jgi:hypothetical protein
MTANRRPAKVTPVIAYADDITNVVIHTHDVAINRTALECCTRATAAILNTTKSIGLAIGEWTQPRTEWGINTYNQIKILGISFSRTIEQSSSIKW